LAKHGISQIRQAPYSPDMAPCDIWFFPKLKMPLKVSMRRARVTQTCTLAAGQRLTTLQGYKKPHMRTMNYCSTLLSFAARIQLLSEKKNKV
jgi:hypothetical protein